jgi:hypothetical protein
VQRDEVAVTWLADGPRPTAALEDEAARLGTILGCPLELRVVG